MTKIGIVLHSHIPYVMGHGVWPHGANYLMEAVSESYIPLLEVLESLDGENLLTFTITPVLLEQLLHPEFEATLKSYLEERLDAAIEDYHHFMRIGDEHGEMLSKFWIDFYENQLLSNLNIAGRFKKLYLDGKIEIITSAATHGYLPLLGYDRCVDAQIKVGIEAFERFFGKKPDGIWLPECAYRPSYEWVNPVTGEKSKREGIEYFLAKYGIKYFIVDSHLIEGGEAVGVYIERFNALRLLYERMKGEKRMERKALSVYRPYLVTTHPSPVAVFGRDKRTGLQVWSGEHGYPGDEWYLEFHKKRFPSGHRYWRVTHPKCDLADKRIYERERALERIKSHAYHFRTLVEEIAGGIDDGFILAPYDTELFGHWWFEGPLFIGEVIEQFKGSDVSVDTPGNYLKERMPEEIINLPEGSWGKGGFHWIWFNEWTEWCWDKIYTCERIMIDVANSKGDERIKSLMARELLLLESSDWEFLISTISAKDYAENRIIQHYEDFMKLYELLKKKELTEQDIKYLNFIDERDRVFTFVNADYYA